MTLRDVLATHWGDVASLAGLALTIWAVLKAKKAAEQARDAAQQVKERIAGLDTLSDVSAAITIMDEIKRLQRLRAWPLVLDRYSVLRRHLVRIEQLNAGLTEEQRTQIARSIAQFRIIEAKVERATVTDQLAQIDSAAFNRTISDRIDELEGIMTAIKQAGV